MSGLYDQEFDEIISLGCTCRSRFQISGTRYRRQPDAAPNAFNMEIARKDETHFFDWLITSPEGVAKCIESRFAKIFDRDQLFIEPTSGFVKHRIYGFRFDHAFTKSGSSHVLPETLDAEYPGQKEKFTYLIEKFIKVLKSPKSIVFLVSRDHLSIKDVELLRHSLEKARLNGLSYVLGARIHDQSTALAVENDRYAFVIPKNVVSKPLRYQWQGDDQTWSDVLDPIRLRPFLGPATRLPGTAK